MCKTSPTPITGRDATASPWFCEVLPRILRMIPTAISPIALKTTILYVVEAEAQNSFSTVPVYWLFKTGISKQGFLHRGHFGPMVAQLNPAPLELAEAHDELEFGPFDGRQGVAAVEGVDPEPVRALA